MRKLLTWIVMVIIFCATFAPNISAQSKIGKIVTPMGDTVEFVALPQYPLVGQYEQPAIYKKWWGEVMACSRYKISPAIQRRPQFFWVQGTMFTVQGWEQAGMFIGFTAPWVDKIYIIMPNMLSEELIKHEMLHYILWHNGIEGHPVEIFSTRCHLKTH